MMTTKAIVQACLELWGGVWCAVMIISVALSKRIDSGDGKMQMLLHSFAMILLLADALAWLFRGYPDAVGYYMVRISNFLLSVTGYFMLSVCTVYLYLKLPTRGQREMKPWARGIYAFCALCVLMVVVNIWTHWFYWFDSDNVYHQSDIYFITQLAGVMIGVIDGVFLLKNHSALHRHVLLALASYIALPTLALVVLIFYYGISLMHVSLVISLIFVFLASQKEYFEEMAVKERQYDERMVRKEQELAELRTAILLSQIRPHFLYNCLTTIKYLCRTDAQEAEKAVGEFARFLQGSLGSLEYHSCIPFETERKHVENYLALEKRRFGRRVQVEWDIQGEGVLPALSLQPVVENAIKHGITRKKKGGIVRISTRLAESNFVITVEDDGVGFDVAVLQEYVHRAEAGTEGAKRRHVGINNVRERLQRMCGGYLALESEPGRGTRAVLTIPQRREENADYNGG